MKGKNNPFEKLARKATVFSGTTGAFIVALLSIVVWLATGYYFNFSDTWQLVINTGTTIITFLMVFLIQRMQNKDSRAVHLKLNELVAALNGPSNRLIDAEELTEHELETLVTITGSWLKWQKGRKRLPFLIPLRKRSSSTGPSMCTAKVTVKGIVQ